MIEIALGKPRNAGILVTELRANGQKLDIAVWQSLSIRFPMARESCSELTIARSSLVEYLEERLYTKQTLVSNRSDSLQKMGLTWCHSHNHCGS